jgi:DNA-binding protein Fis
MNDAFQAVGIHILDQARQVLFVDLEVRQVADQPEGIPANGLYDRILNEIEVPLIKLTLAATRGNQVRAAEILGLNRNTLRKKILDLGVEITAAKR